MTPPPAAAVPLSEKETSTTGEIEEQPRSEGQSQTKHSWTFWLVFAALCLISFISAIDSTIVTVALPTMTRALGGEKDYIWMANVFLFAATATQPFFGQISNIFGRRYPMLISIALFALGSGVTAGANNSAMFIAGRAVQGLGSGGLFVLLDLIVCDLVPLRERGKYLGFMLSTAAIGTVIGPIIGGALAANWRWIFYLNLPISGIALVAMFAFLRVRHNRDPTWKHSLKRVDYIGNAIFIASICSILLGLVMGGTTHPWSSWRIILPLVLGALGWASFHVHQAWFCAEPSVPPHLFKNRTSAIGFVLGFTSSMLLVWVVYFLPLYFQAVLGASPMRAGVDFVPYTAFVVPFGMMAGGFLSKTGKFKPLHWSGFALSAIGSGVLSLLDETSSKAKWVCFQILVAGGTGIVMTALLPSTLAALPEKDVATATATYSFVRSFGFVWGVTLPSLIFNGQFDSRLGQISDVAVRDQLKNGAAYGYASGGYVNKLPDETRHEVVRIYVHALRAVWIAAAAFAAFSFLLVFAEKHVELRKELNTEYGLDDDGKKQSKDGANLEKDEAV
ncbi:major facilitator superfamily domain-containing protein [Lophiotrema nucula]|uniref:Major facilitator superfamily domain-containing protein n=1 Tax=Lophiotrema nucula TaxID=690887 RepID=A0A6A5ZT16_9PLEO|nr:major facilitator superfamily domain-containing protein [Lophiotrema nucula]